MKKIILIILFLTAEVFSQTKMEKIDSLLSNANRINEFNGMALIAENGRVVLHKGYGFYNYEKKKKVISPIPFYIGSVAKQFTDLMVMILKEKELLSYDDSVKKYFPEFKDFMKDITIRQLMTHTSGLSDYYDKIELKKNFNNMDVHDFVMSLDSLEFEPGTQYSYSNTGYVLLAMIIEKIARMPYRNFFINYVLARPQMFGTDVADIPRHKPDERAIGYKKNWSRDDYNYSTYGAGGIYTTSEDLFIYDQLLYDSLFVSQNSLQEAFNPTTLKDGAIFNYGFGWQIKNDTEDTIVFHSGSLNGFRSYFERNLTKKNTIILLSNKSDDRLKEIRDEIIKILSDQKFSYLKKVN